LARIRGISQDFLITGNRRVEDDFTDGATFSPYSHSPEQRSILQGKQCMVIQWGSPSNVQNGMNHRALPVLVIGLGIQIVPDSKESDA
jgi:hypothetical protein